MDNNLLDYNKLLKVLIKSTDKFPKEPLFIQGVVEYMEDYCEIQGKAKEIWGKFWEFFVSEFALRKTLQISILRNFSWFYAYLNVSSNKKTLNSQISETS